MDIHSSACISSSHPWHACMMLSAWHAQPKSMCCLAICECKAVNVHVGRALAPKCFHKGQSPARISRPRAQQPLHSALTDEVFEKQTFPGQHASSRQSASCTAAATLVGMAATALSGFIKINSSSSNSRQAVALCHSFRLPCLPSASLQGHQYHLYRPW